MPRYIATIPSAWPADRVRYDAYLTGRGAMRLANPLIGRTFHRMGAAAHERLRGVLSTP